MDPEWLSNLVNVFGPIPMASILDHCVYYPAAELNGDPVKYLGKYFQSFVYVDRQMQQERVLNNLLNGPLNFTGYDVLSHREIPLVELALTQGPRPNDHDPTFAIWAVFRRNADFCPEHGPERFSLLYIPGIGTRKIDRCQFPS